MIDIDVSTDSQGIGVVVPRGRLTMVSAPQLRTTLDALIADGTSRIVVDLSETSFLDSSGLGALIGALKTARQAGGDLRIARPTTAVLTVLKLTNLDKVLRPRDTVEGAFYV